MFLLRVRHIAWKRISVEKPSLNKTDSPKTRKKVRICRYQVKKIIFYVPSRGVDYKSNIYLLKNYPASRGYIFVVWNGVRKVDSADNRSIFYCACCMRIIRHAIRKELVRQICVSFAGIKIAKTTCEQLSSSFCFVFLLCKSGFKYFSYKISSDRLLRKHYATNCSKSCLIWGEHI